MNERIAQMARDASVISAFNAAPNRPDIEKFAQMIARECAQLAMTQHRSTSSDDYDHMYSYEQGCDDTASAISGLIRRTFGVE